MADLAALHADPRVTWTEDVIRFGDTDMNGHVNNATFSVLAESGRVHLFQSAFGDTRPAGTYFVIAKLTIEFKTELHYPGRVRSGTWIRHVGRSSIGIGQVILGPDGSPAATSDAVCVLMDRATRRSTPFDSATRAAAEALLRSDLSDGQASA